MNTFDGELFTDAFYQNPYEVYEQIREEGEVVWSNAHDAWLIAAHQQVANGLTDPRLSRRLAPRACPRHAQEVEDVSPLEHLDAVVGSMMMFTDPPEHTRLRSLCNKAFTPRSVRKLRPWIRQVINELLAEVQGKRKFDVIEDLAHPLPLIVLCRLLGFPQHDRSRLKRWSDDIIAYAAGYQASDELKRKAVESLVQFEDYFEDLLPHLEADLGDSLLASLAHARLHGDQLNRRELVATALLLLVNGHETITFQIGNALLALLRQPEARRLIVAQPQLMPTAVEELMRYDSAVQVRGVTAGPDFNWQGAEVKQGQSVLLLIGSANRDAAVFEHPDQLRLDRDDQRHLSLGFGFHYCLGAGLARVEIELAVGALLRQFPRMELAADALAWHDMAAFRGLKSLHVKTRGEADLAEETVP